jgi:hypothetical protein
VKCLADSGAQLSAAETAKRTAILESSALAESFASFREQALLEIDLSADRLRRLVWELETRDVRARKALEKADRRVRTAALESIVTDPWTRAALDTRTDRARRAFSRAQRLAFIARRAVEFKFVVDLNNQSDAILTGDVPAHWADDVFLHWYLTEKPIERFSIATVDYVQHLEDFADFYTGSFPFANGSRTVVLSLKDNVVGGYFPCCLDDAVSCPETPERRACGTQPLLDDFGAPVLDENGQPIELTVHQYDYSGELFRRAFTKRCTTGEVPTTASCATAGDPTATTTAYRYAFSISLDQFRESGRLRSLGISDLNYNYRIRDIAVNLVGSNVLDCTQVSGGVTNCYSTAFVSYDLLQTGTVQLRDHSLDVAQFTLPAGGIRDGQGLAAERSITSPIAAADLQLLSQYWAQEFRGRPFQGEFVLELHAADAFQFQALEDVQIIVQLDYWSPFEAAP